MQRTKKPSACLPRQDFFLSSEALLPKELFYRSVPSERRGLCFGFNKMQEKNINPRVLPGG
jgi:hypothetical protein